MEINGKIVCNVCLEESKKDSFSVFVQAVCREENVHICTSCIPRVIHGSGEVVMPNEVVKEQKSQ